MLLVQQYLQTHSFGDLAREHGVYASFSKSGHKFSLNYDQIEAKENDPLAQECRGLILACQGGLSLASQALTLPDKKISYDHLCPGETIILAFPMKRFFNYGQGSAAQIDWSDPNLAVLEKLDGTLCIVYYDPFSTRWCVATRSVPEADLLMDNGVFTFRTLFEKALKETNGEDFDTFTQHLNTKITYCFELTTPYNRIVVNYPKPSITLLAARALYGEYSEFDLLNMGGKGWVNYDDLNDSQKDYLTAMGHDANDTPQALVDKPFNLMGVPTVKSYTYNSISELVNWVSTLNPLEHEGVVVRDGKFNRIKVKNAAYVAYNRLHDSLSNSERNLMELILLEKDDDTIPFLPEVIVDNLRKLKIGLKNAIDFHQISYDIVLDISNAELPGDKKVFAINLNNLAAQKGKYLWTAPLFQIFSSKVSSMKNFIEYNKECGTWGNSFLDRLLELSKLHFHT